jgi:hypothetical protein
MADVKAGPDENNVYLSLMTIGKDCVSYKAKDRPEMEQVLRKLDCVMLQEKHQCKYIDNHIKINYRIHNILIII